MAPPSKTITTEFPLLLSCLPIPLSVAFLVVVAQPETLLVCLKCVACIPVLLPIGVILSCLGSYDRSFTSPIDCLLCPRNFPVREPDESAVVVVGASRGLGRRLVQRLVARGYFVIGTVRKKEDARSLVDEFGPKRVMPVFLELTDHESVETACLEIEELFGSSTSSRSDNETNNNNNKSESKKKQPPAEQQQQQHHHNTNHYLAAVVAVAGVTSMGPFEGIPFDKLRFLVETNVIGTMHVIHRLMPLIRTQKARIVVTGAPDVPLPQYVAKSVCNGALLAFARALRTDLWGLGVSVSILQPAATRGGMVLHAPELIRATRNQMTESLREAYPPGFRLLLQNAAASDFGFDTDWAMWAYEHAIASPRPKTRYATTPPGTALYFASYLLPDRLLETMLFKGPLGPGENNDGDVAVSKDGQKNHEPKKSS